MRVIAYTNSNYDRSETDHGERFYLTSTRLAAITDSKQARMPGDWPEPLQVPSLGRISYGACELAIAETFRRPGF